MSQTERQSGDRQALQENAYQWIKRLILDGTFVAGQRLSEPELAMRFQVSRSPVREALVRLERDGFVVRGANGRVSVAPLDIGELEQLYTVRANLEGMATRLAAPRLRTTDLEAMADKIEIMRRHVRKRSFDAAIEAGQAFHEIILRECNNAPLMDVLGHLRERINRFRSLVASFKSYDAKRIDEHARILDALYRRQPKEAEAAMIDHINRSASVLIAKLQQHRQSPSTAAPASAAQPEGTNPRS